jgi:hypothetical protein
MTQKPENDLRQYFTYGMPLLVLMGSLAVIGIVATIVAKIYFS